MTISRQAKAAATALNIRRVRVAQAGRCDLAPVIAELRASGAATLQAIADGLNRSGILTASGRGE
jgi:hypothetical protein